MSLEDKIMGVSSGGRPALTRLTQKKVVGASSVLVETLEGWEEVTGFCFAIYLLDAQGNKLDETQTDWVGMKSGDNTITINPIPTGGDDQEYPIGAVVECMPTAEWGDRLIQGLLDQHTTLGGHHDVVTDNIKVTESIEFEGDAKVLPKDISSNADNNSIAWNDVTPDTWQMTQNWQDIARLKQPTIVLDRVSTVKAHGTIRVAQSSDSVTDALIQIVAFRSSTRVNPKYPKGINYEDASHVIEPYQFVYTTIGNYQGGNMGISALFPNLPAGTYVFKLRATNPRPSPLLHVYLASTWVDLEVVRD